jgi:hypothetical protein
MEVNRLRSAWYPDVGMEVDLQGIHRGDMEIAQ